MSESCATFGESTSVLEGCSDIVDASPPPLRVTLIPLFSTWIQGSGFRVQGLGFRV